MIKIKKLITNILLVIFIFSFSGVAAARLVPGDYLDTYKHWASSDINTISEKEIMQGVGVTEQGFRLFAPDERVTRAQLAVVLYRTFEFNYSDSEFVQQPVASGYYPDIPDNSWYTNAVTLCALNEIFPELEIFEPKKAVSRIEIAQAIYNSFMAKKISVPMIMLMPMFEDTNSLSPEETNAMVFVNNTGLITANDNQFRPYDELTRAELASVLVRCINLIELNQPVEE